MGLLSGPVMVKSAVQGPRAPSMTGTDLGSGVWATAAVSSKTRTGMSFIAAIIRRSPQRKQRGTQGSGGSRLDEVPLATLRGTAEAAVATWFLFGSSFSGCYGWL